MDACDYVEGLCENMQLYPVQDYLVGDCLSMNYDPQVSWPFTPSDPALTGCRDSPG